MRVPCHVAGMSNPPRDGDTQRVAFLGPPNGARVSRSHRGLRVAAQAPTEPAPKDSVSRKVRPVERSLALRAVNSVGGDANQVAARTAPATYSSVLLLLYNRRRAVGVARYLLGSEYV